jgi:hypothetical protein
MLPDRIQDFRHIFGDMMPILLTELWHRGTARKWLELPEWYEGRKANRQLHNVPIPLSIHRLIGALRRNFTRQSFPKTVKIGNPLEYLWGSDYNVGLRILPSSVFLFSKECAI